MPPAVCELDRSRHLTSPVTNTAGNRTVVYACQSADVLLTGNVAVEQRNILDIRLIVLIADIAEQTGVFLLIFHAQSLDGVEPGRRTTVKPYLSWIEGLKPDTGHINIGSQNIVSVARSAVPSSAGQVEQLVRGGDLIAARRLVVYRGVPLVACASAPAGSIVKTSAADIAKLSMRFFMYLGPSFLKFFFFLDSAAKSHSSSPCNRFVWLCIPFSFSQTFA